MGNDSKRAGGNGLVAVKVDKSDERISGGCATRVLVDDPVAGNERSGRPRFIVGVKTNLVCGGVNGDCRVGERPSARRVPTRTRKLVTLNVVEEIVGVGSRRVSVVEKGDFDCVCVPVPD
jgi:hypothetical protein